MNNTIALTTAQRQEVCAILRNVLTRLSNTPAKVWVFGSRATGRARPYSDLDILINSTMPLSWQARADLQDAFEASNLPFRVDVVEESRLAPALSMRVRAERQTLSI